MNKLNNCKIAVLATDGVEESELTKPVEFLKKHGAQVVIVSDHDGEIQSFKHLEKASKIHVDCTLAQVDARDFDGLELPGGTMNADKLRADKRAIKFVKAFEKAKKPIAAICHAPWLLVSADLVRGRNLTSYHSIQDDISNAGGRWEDKSVIEDKNWVTSRQPDDIPQFNEAMLNLFAEANARPAIAKSA